MNRILLLLLALGAGAAGFKVFQRTAREARAQTAVQEQARSASTNQLARTQAVLAALHNEVQEKKARLREAGQYSGLDPELLPLVEGDVSKGHEAAWAKLRQHLGIGWNSSPDYVLVHKRVLEKLDFPRLTSTAQVAGAAADLLALTPEEQTALQAALQHLRAGPGLQLQRAEPSGDILAQYTALPPDAVAQQSLSNTFAAEIAGVVGPERTALLLPQTWRECNADLWPGEAETMTIRRSTNSGELDLVCEMSRGDKSTRIVSRQDSPLLEWVVTQVEKGPEVSTSPVRYAHYPSNWFLTLFPGGWEDLARREGFELPAAFRKQ